MSGGFSCFARFVLPARVDGVCATPPYLRFGNPAYGARLVGEAGEVEAVGFWPQLCFAAEVVRLARLSPRVPHVCRGSAGSSLLCYLVGITDIDPVAHGIAFTRFLGGRSRSAPPDVDLDFPAHMREEVWRRVRERFGGRVGFLATELRYRERGALREALRRLGVAPSVWLSGAAAVPQEMRGRVESLAASLVGRRYAFARHCGGLVLFPQDVPDALKLARPSAPFAQTSLVKDSGEVKRRGKLDVLSNRGLGHLALCGYPDPTDPVRFPPAHAGAGNLFSAGDTWGIVQGESPAMRKLFVVLGARTREAVVLALGLVRPAVGGGKGPGAVGRNPLERLLVYEDDVAEFLGVALGCSPGGAEQARRALSGGGPEAQEVLSRVESYVGRRGRVTFRGASVTVSEARRQLGMAKAFGFCKAHATAYGHLVWALGCVKASEPENFWQGFVNSGSLASSMYLPWVHFERVKSSLGVSVAWPGDFGLRPTAFYSLPWRFSGGVFGPDVSSPALAEGLGADRSSWIRQLQVAGFWEGGFAPIPGTWLVGDEGAATEVSFRALSALKSPRTHPLEDGRVCLFETLGYGRLGLLERSRVFPSLEAAEAEPASLFVRGSGSVASRFGLQDSNFGMSG